MHDAHDLPALSVTYSVRMADASFGEGCDARLAGRPSSANPYHAEQRILRDAWKRGWKHIDSVWGVEANWPVRELVKVRA